MTPAGWTCLALLAALALGLTIERIWLAAAKPLWFDEAWTAALATTPTWRSLLHEAYVDVNAPLFYALERAWTQVVGASDLALRTPGLIGVAIAAAAPMIRPMEGITRLGRITWGMLIYAWWGVGVFLDGRCYGMLLALSVLQCISFAELLRDPRPRAAWMWSALGALAVLTHYYALFVTAAQGLVLLVAHRRAAMRLAPALLAFAPAVGWMAFHASRLAAFSSPTVAWHEAIAPAQAFALAAGTLNPSAPLVGLVALGALLAGVIATGSSGLEGRRHLWLCVLASGLALGLTLVSGMFKPSLTARYLLPTAPGLLLGLAMLAQASPRPRLACAAIAAAYLVAATPLHLPKLLHTPPPYGFETASKTLMDHRVSNVLFVWDHEAVRLIPPDTLERVGGVFFRRAGYGAPVSALALGPNEDLNRAVLREASSGARPGVIWLYNRRGNTAARRNPPAIAAIDPRWRCDRVGDEELGTLACWR